MINIEIWSSIVLTNNFHNYLYRRRRVNNYLILFFSFFSCVQESEKMRKTNMIHHFKNHDYHKNKIIV